MVECKPRGGVVTPVSEDRGVWIAAVRDSSRAGSRDGSGWLLQSMDGAGGLEGRPWAAQRLGEPAPPGPGGPLPATPQPPPRYVWTSTAAHYPAMLAGGERIARCHDLEVVGNLLE